MAAAEICWFSPSLCVLSPMSHRVRLCSVEDIPVGYGREFTVGDRIFAVFHVGDAFHVIDGICPHAGGPLAEGVLQGSVVTCPWHGWQFDVSTGRHCLTERIQQTRYECGIEDDGVVVVIPE
jgi:nitrite reductase (NADH) small subunit